MAKDGTVPAPWPRETLAWANSKTVGQVSEIAVLAPVRVGAPPGERRTYEERLKGAIDNIAERHLKGLPTELSRVPSIHFGRVMLIRPEQYSLNGSTGPATETPSEGPTTAAGMARPAAVPHLDDWVELPMLTTAKPGPEAPTPRTWVLTLVEFDGDLKVYMRDIAQFLGRDFDLIFENCEDYPSTRNFEPFWAWVRRYQINTDLFYASYSHLSVVRIRQLETFKRRFDAFVAKVRAPHGRRVESMDELFDEFLRENLQYAEGFPSASGLFNPRSTAEEG